jgi:chromosome segregation ATPase
MSNELKNLIRENKSEMNISSAKLEEINNTLETLNRQQEDYLKKVQEREAMLEQKRKEIQARIDETEEKIGNISITDVSSIQKEREKWEEAWNKLDGKIGHISSQLSSKETLRKLKVKEIDQVNKAI